MLWEVKNMSLFNCNCKCSCTALAVVASVILGVVAAFLQITAVITVTPVFLWVALGIAVAYLGVLLVSAALRGSTGECVCICTALNALLTGILGTILFAVVLLAVGIVATGVATAILLGLVVLFLSLPCSATACYVKGLAGCGC